MPDLSVVILAAGRGTRMESELPKALHPICGQPMLWHALQKAQALAPRRIVVVAGYRYDRVSDFVRSQKMACPVKIAVQDRLLGSGHAVAQAERALAGAKGTVLVLYCDTPLVSDESIAEVLKDHRKYRTVCTLLSVQLGDPTGYGRVCRDAGGAVTGIVEQGDCSDDQKRIREINVGCYAFSARTLFKTLRSVKKNPKKGEYYLTDAVGLLASGSPGAVRTVEAGRQEEMLGVNTRLDLSYLQETMQKSILESLIRKGVRIRDPKTTVIDAGVSIGRDTEVLPHTVIEGGSVIGRGCTVGPFARIRGGSVIGDHAVIGNFVEVVRSKIGTGTQVKHLSYLGDAEVGAKVNIGAGTITANYDGKNKHRTVIRDGAQIGSGTILVAPVTVGRSAKTGAGAVVTKGKNVPDGGTVFGVPARVWTVKKRK